MDGPVDARDGRPALTGEPFPPALRTSSPGPDDCAVEWHSHEESANQFLALDTLECKAGPNVLPGGLVWTMADDHNGSLTVVSAQN